MMRPTPGLLAGLLLSLWAAPAAAQEAPTTELVNTCDDAGGMGVVCANDDDCAARAFATACVQLVAGDPASRRCQVPCGAEGGGPDEAQCALGERCVEPQDGGQPYCRPAAFRMDLNLLDQCVAHFLQGIPPVLGQQNACSLEANLARLLDQDSDLDFDIFDADLCVAAFLDQPICDPDAETCPDDDLRFCREDEECGEGLFCDPDRHFCTRECGLVAAREVGFEALERRCAGRLKSCNWGRGRCEAVDPAETTCQVDAQCPDGAYCFLGRCAPECSRGIECPDSSWFCAENGRCRVQPSPAGDPEFVFEPASYSVLFGAGSVTLTAIEDETEARLLIMDLTTKREVRNNPSIGFGYRLEVTYALKQEARCFRPTDEWTLEDRDDCLIDPSEEFVIPLAPFGTVFASGRPAVRLRLDHQAVGRLTPGIYMATVDAIFDNGSRDRFLVHYEKLTPSGEYSGTMTVAMGHPDNTLEGRTPLGLALRLHVKDEQVRWNDLLEANNLLPSGGQDLLDLTEGQVVHGELFGNRALPFALPDARSPADNTIPIKGIYSPRSGMMRLIGTVDLPASFCLAEDGPCDGQDDGVTVDNPFGRDIRRVFQLAGTYEDATRRYYGVYRERISGLLPGEDLTLDGAFLLDQAEFDASEFSVQEPLLADGAQQVTFPEVGAVMSGLDRDIAEHCEQLHPQFDNASAYAAYLESGSFPVLADMLTFEGLISEALAGLGRERDDEANERILTLYDYLSGWIVPCEEDEDPGVLARGGGTACLDATAARCGLALYRKAIVGGFVLPSDVGEGGGGELPLFCSPVIPVEGCRVDPVQQSALTTLYEHNRFHQELSQALKFHGDRDLSDAFFTLYRHQYNPFAEGAALSYKAEKLESAFSTYSALSRLFLSSDAASVFWLWPMERFQTRGNEWLRQMQVIIEDRLEVQRQLVDLRRRLFASTDRSDRLLAEHMGQVEYLVQVYLMALQRHWQGDDFRTVGRGAEVFATVQNMLLQLHEAKNPLGFTPDQVFFENSDLQRPNWENYLARLVGDDGGGGLMAQARGEVDTAVTNLRDALRDVDSLENNIFAALGEYDDTLTELCGPAVMADVDTVCDRMLAMLGNPDAFDPDEWFEDVCADLGEPGHPVLPSPHGAFVRYDDACQEIITVFRDNYDHASDLCPLRNADTTVFVRGRERPCVGGQMGALIAEQTTLLTDLGGLVAALQRGWADIETYIEDRHMEWVEAEWRWAIDKASNLLQSILAKIQDSVVMGTDIAQALAEMPDCVIVAGLAVGTDCGGHVAASAADIGLTGTKWALVSALELVLENWDAIVEALMLPLEIRLHQAATERDVAGLVSAFGENFDNFGPDVQRIANVELQKVQLLYEAQYAADRLDASIANTLDHLVGRETGSVLVGNEFVSRAAKTFSRILDTTYRMVMAFNHRHNLPGDEANALVERVYQAVTLDDVQAIIDTLVEEEELYCGREGIDCDTFNNVSVLRFSLRDELFPDLRDIVDPRTGRVVTKGEQFHNLITSPPYLRRRVRGNHTADQIEIPFTVWLQMLEVGGGERWMIDPTQCNHHLAGGDWESVPPWLEGTLAVNVLGNNLDGGYRSLRYEMVRGHADWIRSCHAEAVVEEIGTMPVLDFPIRRHIVGYAPQSVQGQQPSPPTYVTRSGEMSACINFPVQTEDELVEAACWHFFARDRSLAAPDWMMIVPLRFDGAETTNTWVTGEGLPDNERPLIEDIEVYLRYRSRPVQEY